MRIIKMLLLNLVVAFTMFSQITIENFLTSDARKAMDYITEDYIRANVQFLSHDLLEGRGTGSKGELLAATYIATQFKLMGLEPGGDDGSYFQKVPLSGITTFPDEEMIVKGKGKTIRFKYYDEFIAVSGVKKDFVSIKDAEIVFVGYGIVAPEQNWDDYKGVDVSGKILLMLNDDPPATPDEPNLFGGKARTYYGRWTYKYEIAAKKGALGAIIIHTTPSAGYGWNVVQSSWSGEEFELANDTEPKVLLKGWLTEDATRRMLALVGKNLDELVKIAQTRQFKPVDLGLKLSLNMRVKFREITSQNVIGILRGGDEKLKDEFVVITSHHDHLGIGKPVNGDSIYNGALDNASGVSAMLAIAKAFSELKVKPRRSVMFIALTAEEAGLLGSRYFAQNPTVPPVKIVANLNVDGINIWGRTRDVILIGMEKSTLGEIINEIANKYQGRYAKPDQFPELGLFYRSDQFNFAKVGIPAVFFDNGVEYVDKPEDYGKKVVEEYIAKNYHQPSDEYNDSWVLDGAVEDAKLVFMTVYYLANSDAKPEWKPDSEFRLIREQMMK
ncbi:M28 family metallopeptidase [Candidatus Kryptobacter tengchongensis]|uniref:Zn-dependent amino-or carboxypeptidase, M28 family n=1 Tax=Kryptobacter tengchongensis TaxID=1643429 RepID=A0A656D7B3_KRYT1|nr:M28 family metallopeptidase [Candidatus Kryptobacter tengchongensis]CUT00166.1 Zn-dependent amino-or carboxypeptidase, M28 family [Candidatus Kryptobacter tengchongensis]